jgi:ABC-2 type transport system permease protein
MLKLLFHSIYYHLINYLRIKQAVFFSLAFPVFLFLVFGSIWGIQSEEYVALLFSGVLGMTIASDGLFAIGPVVREYYASGLIKYLRKLPMNILSYFIGLIISRILSLLVVLGLLSLEAHFVFGYSISAVELLPLIEGIVVGLFLFSFLGLAISFSGIKHGSERGLINFIFFGILFTSNAFYPVEMFNGIVAAIGNALPLNPVLRLLRGEGADVLILLWLMVPAVVFYFLFRKVKFAR